MIITPAMKEGPILDNSLIPPKFRKTAEPHRQRTGYDLGNGKKLVVAIPGFFAIQKNKTFFITTYMYNQETKIYYCFLPFTEEGKRIKFNTLLLIRNSGSGLGCLMEDAKKLIVHKGGPLYGFPKSLFTVLSREDLGHVD